MAFVSWWSITNCLPTVKFNSGEEKAICTFTVKHTCSWKEGTLNVILPGFLSKMRPAVPYNSRRWSASSKLTTKALETFCPSSWWLRQIGRPQLWILIQLWQKEGANFSEMLVFNSALTERGNDFLRNVGF